MLSKETMKDIDEAPFFVIILDPVSMQDPHRLELLQHAKSVKKRIVRILDPSVDMKIVNSWFHGADVFKTIFTDSNPSLRDLSLESLFDDLGKQVDLRLHRRLKKPVFFMA